MKKIISFILICSMLLAFLTGCSYFDKTNEGEGGNETDNVGDGNNTNGSTEGGNTGGTTDGTDNVTNGGETEEDTKAKGIPLDKESDVIESIIDYIDNYYSDHDMGDNSLEYKIRLTVNGVWRPIEVTFDTFDYYFVCGYDNDPGDDYYESRAKKCNWYKFNSAEEIPEYYNGEKCAYVFQFNKASSIVNLLEGQSDVPEMEHFLWYRPEFEDGYNAKPPIAYGETIIYLCYTDYLSVKIWDEGTIYYSTSSYDYKWVTIPTVDIYGDIYISMLTNQILSTGEEVEISLDGRLGNYTEFFVDKVEIDKYSISYPHCTYYYSCILVEDFIKILNEEILN